MLTNDVLDSEIQEMMEMYFEDIDWTVDTFNAVKEVYKLAWIKGFNNHTALMDIQRMALATGFYNDTNSSDT